MATVVNPYLPLASPGLREEYLALVRKVAEETQENEPECLAYCWTKPVDELANESPALVQGIEIYEHSDALAATHRSSDAYKHMRKVVAEKSLVTYPSGGVRTYKLTGASLLSRKGATEAIAQEEYFVFKQYTAQGQENLARLLAQQHILGELLQAIPSVLSYGCFISENREEILATIFLRLPSQNHYEGPPALSVDRFESDVLGDTGITQTRSWGGRGFGFFRQGTLV